jgi:hypothetical protein
MNRFRFLLAAALLAAHAGATTYTFTSANYGAFGNYTSPCATGPCANYTSAMDITGSFTTASPLAANLASQDITSQVVSYSFFDGITTYTNTSPNARIYEFFVATGGSGQITTTAILLEIWQTGASPHAAGNRVALVVVGVGTTPPEAFNNFPCSTVGTSPFSGVSDACIAGTLDAATSTANASSGTWTIAAPTVPALGKPGILFLAALLVLCAWYSLRRRSALGKA